MTKLQGIATGVSAEGIGHVAWSFIDTSGMLRTLKLPAYYVSRAKARLLITSTSLLNEYLTSESLLFLHTFAISVRAHRARTIKDSLSIERTTIVLSC